MHYVRIDKLKKVVAWTNKCGGSSARMQIILDLNDPEICTMVKPIGSLTAYDAIVKCFEIDPKPITIPEDYEFIWYVRDPFYRLVSCFLNRKVKMESSHQQLTFKGFISNLNYYRQISSNVKNHTECQTENYFQAPWQIIDIAKAKFDFNPDCSPDQDGPSRRDHKYNATNYGLGYKQDAWNLPSKQLFQNDQTYEPLSFYSKEILSKIRNFYSRDYEFLTGKIDLVE